MCVVVSALPLHRPPPVEVDIFSSPSAPPAALMHATSMTPHFALPCLHRLLLLLLLPLDSLSTPLHLCLLCVSSLRMPLRLLLLFLLLLFIYLLTTFLLCLLSVSFSPTSLASALPFYPRGFTYAYSFMSPRCPLASSFSSSSPPRTHRQPVPPSCSSFWPLSPAPPLACRRRPPCSLPLRLAR